MADTFTLEDLTTPLTRAEVQQSIYDVLATLGVNTTSWKSGAVVRTMLVCVSSILSALSELEAEIAKSGFLAEAEADWLTLVARFVYGIERIDATFATGLVTLENSGGGVYEFDPDDLIFSNADTGATYRNTEAVSIGAMQAVSVPVQATQAGSIGNAGAGQIHDMTTVVLGVTCSNPSALVGTDAESDAQLRDRCSMRLGALSPMGPWDAYASAVRNATRPDGSSIGVTRIRIVKDGYGVVKTYLAGSSGAIEGDAEDPSSDLGIANEAIQRNAAPLAVNAQTYSARNHPIDVTYEVWMYNTSGMTEDDIRATIQRALEDFMRGQPIGGNVVGSELGKVYVSAIQTAIFRAIPGVIFDVDVLDPAADVELEADEVPVAGAAVAMPIHQEPPPEGFGGAVS